MGPFKELHVLYCWNHQNNVSIYRPLFLCSGFILDSKFLVNFNDSNHQVVPECLFMPALALGTRYRCEGAILRYECPRTQEAYRWVPRAFGACRG